MDSTIIDNICYIFYTFCIIAYLLYCFYWFDCRHYIVCWWLNLINPLINYLGLWHGWNMFSVPHRINHSIFVSIEYDNSVEERFLLYCPGIPMFLDRKLDSYIIRYVDNLFGNDMKITKYCLVRYLYNMYNKETKAIKKIQLILQEEKITDPKENKSFEISDRIVYTYDIP